MEPGLKSRGGILAAKAGRLVYVLLAAYALLLAYVATRNSVTFDEYAHLPAGVAYWRHGDFAIYNLSPPLLRLWGALPAVLAGAKAPPTAAFDAMEAKDRHWRYGEAFLRANFEDYHRLFVLGRWGLIPLSCLAGWIVYRWATELYGPRAGLAACALYVLCPNMSAHASLVGTDAGTSAAMLAGSWLWWRFCRRPDVKRGTAACLAVGLAQLCKFTALFLWPVVVGMAIAFAVADHRWRRRMIGVIAAAASTLVLVNLAYGFKGTGQAIGSYEFRSDTMKAVQGHLPRGLPVPLPRDLVSGFDAQKWEAQATTYQGFLLGEVYAGPRWYYYPVTLACKLPLGILLLGVLAAVGVVMWNRLRTEELPLLGTLLAFVLGMILLTDLNIGARYLLPAFPLGFILMGRIWAPPGERQPPKRGAMVAWTLVAVLAMENLWACPNYLSFVNLAAGGTASGYRRVNDSNFDWGQGLLDLKQWMLNHDVPRVQLAYFGRVDPTVYGIEFTPLTDPVREPYVAISSYFMVGLAHRLATPQGPTPFMSISFGRELQAKTPIAVVDSTIFIYRWTDVVAAKQEASRGGGPARPLSTIAP